MKQGMIDIKLVDVCGIQYGCPFDASLFSTSPSEGMPLIRIRDVKGGQTETYYSGEYSPEFIIRKGDYLIGMDGEFNIAPWQSEDALLNQRVCKIYTKSQDVVIRYVYRFLQKELKKIEDETPFVTVKHLSAKRLNQVYLPVPPIAEQEKIVAELDCLSGIIEKKKQQLKELDNLAQSIFYEMFGNPVENDKGWKVLKLKELSSLIINGTTPKGGAEVYVDNGILFLRSQNVWRNHIDYEDVAHIDEKTNASMKKSILHKHDILITKTGRINTENSSLGRAALFEGETGSANINGHVYLIRINEKLVLPRFVLSILTGIAYRDYIRKVCVGGIDKRQINKEHVEEFPIIIPSVSMQKQYVETIEAIEKQKELIKQSVQETETLFNSRMDYYFN